MNIAVCVKEVPSGTSHKRLDPATNRLDRSGDSELNPFDLHALEEAVRIREGGADVAEIVAVCMGPPSAQRALQKALALGADRAVLVTDPALAGSDIAGTAHVLAAVLGKQSADLVLLGQQAADADCYVMAAAGPGQAPDRARLRRRRGAAAGRHLGLGRDQHAAAPVHQGDHGCQEEAARDALGRRRRR